MNATNFDDFASDDIDAEFTPAAPAAAEPFEHRATYDTPCTKCRGSGMWVSYSGYTRNTCFACKGKGFLTYKTAPEVRAKAAASRANSAVRSAENNWEAFVAAHPEVAAWMDANTSFEFAVSLKAAVIKYGDLSERQLASAQKCVESNKARAAARQANAPVVDISKVETAIQTALAKGVKRPSMRVGELKFSIAPETSKNAGAIYVKTAVKGEEGQYLGKIAGGKLFALNSVSAEMKAKIVEVAADPKGAAIRHGKEFGQCSICSRTLVDPKSIELGIGPICAVKMGW
jgi:hypothetical protein